MQNNRHDPLSPFRFTLESGGAAVASFVGAVGFPVFSLVIAPLLFGPAHVTAGLDSFARHRNQSSTHDRGRSIRQVTPILAAIGFVGALRVSGFYDARGFLEVIAATLAAIAIARRIDWILIAVSSGVALAFVAWPTSTVGALALLHPLTGIAFGLAPKKQNLNVGVAVAAFLWIAGTIALLSGAMDSLLHAATATSVTPAFARAFDQREFAASLAGKTARLEPWASRLVAAVAFGQLLHYWVWLRAIPRSVGATLSWARVVIFFGLAAIGLFAWKILGAAQARILYLGLFGLHGYVEITMLTSQRFAARSLAAIAFAAVFVGCATIPKPLPPNPWAQASRPTAGDAEPIGFYSAGCLRGARSMPADGSGFASMRISRRRFYGHPDLLEYIQNLGREVARAKLGTLLVGDLGQPRGGPAPSGHASHQIGLDVDLWFWLDSTTATKSPLTLDQRENLSAPSMLKIGGDTRDEIDVTRFGAAQITVLRLATADPRVERIFVNPVIKRELCAKYGQSEDNAFLHKLRPWWGHDDHFHVRLACPPGAALCKKQEVVADGTGCDATLDEWFTPDMLKKFAEDRAKPTNQPNAMPKLPEACDAVLIQP